MVKQLLNYVTPMNLNPRQQPTSWQLHKYVNMLSTNWTLSVCDINKTNWSLGLGWPLLISRVFRPLQSRPSSDKKLSKKHLKTIASTFTTSVGPKFLSLCTVLPMCSFNLITHYALINGLIARQINFFLKLMASQSSFCSLLNLNGN